MNPTELPHIRLTSTLAMRLRRYVLMITAPILATSVLLLVLGGTAAWYVHRVNREISDLLARNLNCTIAAEQLVLDMRDASLKMHRFMDTGDESELRAVVSIEQKTSRQLRDAEQAATTDEIRDLVAQTRRVHDQFFAEFSDVIRDMPAAARQQKVRELVQTITANVLQPAERLLEHTQQSVALHINRNQSAAESIGLGLLVLGTCGAVSGLMAGFAIARGIARRIELSERAAARAEQLAAVGQLAAGLAHELRNPLTAMRVLVETGHEHFADARGLDRRDLEVLDEEITRLEKLVDSFLDFARPPQLEKTTFDARTLVEQTLHLMGGPARQRHIAIDWKPPSEAIAVEADAVQLRQVLLNLLLNALDAAGEDGTVTIEAGLVSRPPQAAPTEGREVEIPTCHYYAVIQIADSGPGVAAEMKERIFEPFVSSKETGIGLGLPVSRRIVEAHCGAITVADNPGGGARFTIWLPRGDKSRDRKYYRRADITHR